MGSAEMMTSSATLRVLTQEMLDVILAAVWYLLAMHQHGAVAMHASDGATVSTYNLSNGNFLPTQFGPALYAELALFFAANHQLIRHVFTPPGWRSAYMTHAGVAAIVDFDICCQELPIVPVLVPGDGIVKTPSSVGRVE